MIRKLVGGAMFALAALLMVLAIGNACVAIRGF